MYYHVVYDRKDTNTQLSRVYYRRSIIPYNRNHDTKIIKWGNEVLISDTIKYTQLYDLPLLPDTVLPCKAGVNISCKYPAIVVRYNEEANTAFTYIVFTCSQPVVAPESKVFLVECAFPHDSTFDKSGPLYPIAWGLLGSQNDDQYVKFGGCSVNGSYNGNYYALCDSSMGIIVGFKTPNDRGRLTNRTNLKYDFSTGICSQPSLNTYSRMNIHEENCAVVFKEVSEGNDRIIYSRLHLVNGLIDAYVPLNFCIDTIYQKMCWYGWDNKTALINFYDLPTVKFNAEYPSIYRPAEFALRPGFEYADSMHYVGACWDRVYWQSNVTTYVNGS